MLEAQSWLVLHASRLKATCSVWVERGQTLRQTQININQTISAREILEPTLVDLEGVPPLIIVLRPGYLPIEQACVFHV